MPEVSLLFIVVVGHHPGRDNRGRLLLAAPVAG
jgi:hypothetical protein